MFLLAVWAKTNHRLRVLLLLIILLSKFKMVISTQVIPKMRSYTIYQEVPPLPPRRGCQRECCMEHHRHCCPRQSAALCQEVLTCSTKRNNRLLKTDSASLSCSECHQMIDISQVWWFYPATFIASTGWGLEMAKCDPSPTEVLFSPKVIITFQLMFFLHTFLHLW